MIGASALGILGKEKSFIYYNLDQVATVKGTIIDISIQRSYHKNDFVVIALSSTNPETVYNVEVCPQWFFQLDLMKGMEIEVTGSATVIEGKNFMMTRSLMYSGELYNFRDTNGFPLWRGQGNSQTQGRGMQRRRQGRR